MLKKEGRQPRQWVRLSSLGTELAAAVAGLGLIGYWIDRHFGSDPWALIAGATLGFVGGMYNLLKTSIRAFRATGQSEDGSANGKRKEEG